MTAALRCLPRLAVAAMCAASLPAQWGAIATGTAPAPRAGALLAHDPLGNRTLMFGGNWSNEFWSYAGGTWTQLNLPLLPGPRARADMATDPLLGTVLLYGGDDTTSQFATDETWSWDGNAWQLLQPAATPGGLARHALAFDQQRQVFVLFGGRNNSWLANQGFDQTWEFANGNWQLMSPQLSPPPLRDLAMSWHPGLSKVMLFGGVDNTGAASDQTWAYDGAGWVQMHTTGMRPPARTGARMVPVLGRNLCVLVGGRDPVTQQIFNDTWEHDGVNWTPVAGVYAGMYPARDGFGLAHDLVRNRLVCFGGQIANGSLRNDTWEYGAQFQPFGFGCPGSAGVPALVAGAPATLGSITGASITNVPSTSPFALMAVGLSRTQWSFGSLPMLLDAFGMPGCRTYTSADLLTAVPAVSGTATWSFGVPLQPNLVGVAFYLQGVVLDPGLNALGLSTTNAAVLVLGN
jgi:hypothetical protein